MREKIVGWCCQAQHEEPVVQDPAKNKNKKKKRRPPKEIYAAGDQKKPANLRSSPEINYLHAHGKSFVAHHGCANGRG
nr:hypothetical protein Iba_chr04eCG19570 [Ipomoea batatas]